MSLRALLIVAVSLIALIAIALLSQRAPNESPRTDSLFAPELRARLDEVDSIVLREANDETVATLNRTEAGWVVAERDNYPADTTKIRAALTALADARIVEAKTANPELHERLGLSDVSSADARGVSVTLEPVDPSAPPVILGDSEGTSYRYVRRAGEDQTYLIDADPEISTDTAEWLVPDILDVSGDRIERIVIEHADGERVEMFKSEVGQSNYEVADVPAGRELQYPGVANVTGNALRNLRLEDVAARGATAPDPEVVTEFTTFDGLIVRAEGLRIDDEGWLAFAARPDTELGDASETTAAPETDDRDAADDAGAQGTPDDAAAQPEDTSGDAVDVATEAEQINDRVAGWRYRIPSYQYSQIARRMDDLLRAEDSTN